MPEQLGDRDLERTLSDIGTRLDGPKRDLWPAVRARMPSAARSRGGRASA